MTDIPARRFVHQQTRAVIDAASDPANESRTAFIITGPSPDAVQLMIEELSNAYAPCRADFTIPKRNREATGQDDTFSALGQIFSAGHPAVHRMMLDEKIREVTS